MKLGMSNLAWAPDETALALDTLAAEGMHGVEVAPTRLAAWDALTPDGLRAFRGSCAARGLAVSSLQAIFFGRADVSLLGEESAFLAMVEHMKRVADIAVALGAGVAVFGAPKSRLRGAMPLAEARALAVERFRRLGGVTLAAGLVIGIEPVSASYGADFLNHASEVVSLVAECDHDGVATHLDTACVTLAGDRPEAAISAANGNITHYHMAEPDLAGFDAPSCDHAAAGAALRAVGYDRWVVAEMRESAGDLAARLATAARFAKSRYLGEASSCP